MIINTTKEEHTLTEAIRQMDVYDAEHISFEG